MRGRQLLLRRRVDLRRTVDCFIVTQIPGRIDHEHPWTATQEQQTLEHGGAVAAKNELVPFPVDELGDDDGHIPVRIRRGLLAHVLEQWSEELAVWRADEHELR